MCRWAAILVVIGSLQLAGCLRLELETASEAPSSAVVLSEAGSVVLCPVAAAVSADGSSYGVVWHEYPASLDVLHLMFARVSASGELESGPAAVGPLEGELADLALVAVDGGFAASLIGHGDPAPSVIALTNDGRLHRGSDELPDSVRAATGDQIACGGSAQGPDEIASAYRAQHGGELRVVVELH